MKFPSNILPNPNRKKINCDLSQFILIRHTNTADVNELKDPSTGFIKDKYICDPSEQVSDLSTNLLGVFKKEYIYLQLTPEGKVKYNDYCEPNSKVNTPVFATDFILNDNRHYWTLNIGDVNNTIATYKKGSETMNAQCFIEHSPMLWNFWHFSVRWKTDEGIWHQLPDNKKKNIAKRLRHEARSHIKMFAKIELPDFKSLPQNCYEESKGGIITKAILAISIGLIVQKAFSVFFKKRKP